VNASQSHGGGGGGGGLTSGAQTPAATGGGDHQHQHQASKFASTPGAVTALRVNYASTDRAFTHSPATTDPRLVEIRKAVRQIASGPALGDKPTWNTSVHTPGSDLPQRAPQAANSAYQGTKLDYNFRAATLPPVNQFIYVPKPSKLKVDESVFLSASERARLVKTCVTTNVGLSRREFSNNLASGATGSVNPLQETLGAHVIKKNVGGGGGGEDSNAINYVVQSMAGQRGMLVDISPSGWNSSTLPDNTDIMKPARAVPPPAVVASDTTTPVSHTMYTQKNKSRNAVLLGLASSSSSDRNHNNAVNHQTSASTALSSSASSSTSRGGGGGIRSGRSSAGVGAHNPHHRDTVRSLDESTLSHHHAGCAYVTPAQRQAMLIEALRLKKVDARNNNTNASPAAAAAASTTPAFTMKNRHEWVGKCPVDVAGGRAQIAASQLQVPFNGDADGGVAHPTNNKTAPTTAYLSSVPVPPGSLGRVRRHVHYPRRSKLVVDSVDSSGSEIESDREYVDADANVVEEPAAATTTSSSAPPPLRSTTTTS